MKVDVNKLKAVTEPVLQRLGYELWDLEFGTGPSGAVLRITIDGIGGVTIDDCTRVSRDLSPTLDAEDLIHVPYSLEVSSPGLERVLREEQHFRRVLGSRARIRTRDPVRGRRNFDGRVLAAEAVRVTVEADAQVWDIAIDSIQRANVVYEWEASGRPAEKGR